MSAAGPFSQKPRPDPPAPDDGVVDGLVGPLLRHAEVQAELLIARLRLVVVAMLVAMIATSLSLFQTRPVGHVPLLASITVVVGFTLTSTASLSLIRRGRYRPQLGWVFALLDVVVAVAALAEGGLRNGLAGNDLFLLASAWAGPLVLAFNALRYRPVIVASAAVLYVAGALAVALALGVSVLTPLPTVDHPQFADLPANLVRLSLIVLLGLCLTLVVYRGRGLLLRALKEERERAILTRFLPGEVADELTRPNSHLREGISIECTVVFVDLRGSTALAERLSPAATADFLSRYRERIARVAGAHGGLIEKFVGDGAFIVFGAPSPKADDSTRAVACAKQLLATIAEWNAERAPAPPLAIVVALHTGRCFCGVVGAESRLEFTVVGDTVNVAARLEQLAKRLNRTLIASQVTLRQAGEDLSDGRWVRLGSRPLRGHEAPVEVYVHEGNADP
ncbi:MAG: adenylate/guanylate cyclase domain-containing protein [Alphaproteobacteria bacterium]|nr:adenylate/guanylate cyclase domain-containing protein [Alphaproteobacteria bacterium]MBV8408590.1 adenylate/guanylate cyclase domain-containing protein [Alphaproteobacteria bacterium]